MEKNQKLIAEYLRARGTDLFVFSSEITQNAADAFIELLLRKNGRRETGSVFLTTFGGDPDAAYRIARVLRRSYKTVRVLIAGVCKSAGTLVALTADELAFSDYGEIGPLDTQISKPDEILSRHSGLDIVQSMDSITQSTFQCFEEHMLHIIRASGGAISTKVAADIAIQLTSGVMAPISAQIDPVRLGSARRAIDIARAYGFRLAQNARNLKANSLNQLIDSYPAHGFVIDVEEAKELFSRVEHFDESENAIFALFRDQLRSQSEQQLVFDIEILLPDQEGKEDDTEDDRREDGQHHTSNAAPDPDERTDENGSLPHRRKPANPTQIQRRGSSAEDAKNPRTSEISGLTN